MEKLFLDNLEVMQYSMAALVGVIITADLIIRKYIKNRRKKATCELLKRRFEYFRY